MSKFVKILTKFWPKIWPQFRELDFELRESVKILTQILTTFSELDFEPRKSVKILPRFRPETRFRSETAFRSPKPRFDPRNRVLTLETRKSAPNPSETAKNAFFCDFRSWSKISLIWSTFFDFSEILWISPIFFRRNPRKHVFPCVPSARKRKNVLQIKETRFRPRNPISTPISTPVSTPVLTRFRWFRPPKCGFDPRNRTNPRETRFFHFFALRKRVFSENAIFERIIRKKRANFSRFFAKKTQIYCGEPRKSAFFCSVFSHFFCTPKFREIFYLFTPQISHFFRTLFAFANQNSWGNQSKRPKR